MAEQTQVSKLWNSEAAASLSALYPIQAANLLGSAIHTQGGPSIINSQLYAKLMQLSHILDPAPSEKPYLCA